MRRSASEIINNLERRIARLERTSATRKVAGHIILAGNVNVRQIRRDLEDTFGIEDIDFEDGVITFLMSSMDNKKVEKQVKALAQKHDVKFEKGDFTDGLGMIYTKQASRTKVAMVRTLRDRMTGVWSDYATEIRNEMMNMIKADGVTQYRPRYMNSVKFGSQKVDMGWSQTSTKSDVMEVMITGKGIQTETFMTKNLANMDPKAAAEWIWMKTPARFKR